MERLLISRDPKAKTLRWRKFDGTTGVLHKKNDGSWIKHIGMDRSSRWTHGVFHSLRDG